eukprot:m.64497 g.64497  ORF g.64497 m.64497 type:complete len:1228 (-) comp7523_c0_seq2:50-3733(-)
MGRQRGRQQQRRLATKALTAAAEDSVEELQRIKGAPHLVDKFGRTALHAAATAGAATAIDWLVESGADLDARDAESGWTALHRALYAGQLCTALRLSAAGANLGVRDREGLVPSDLVSLYIDNPALVLPPANENGSTDNGHSDNDDNDDEGELSDDGAINGNGKARTAVRRRRDEQAFNNAHCEYFHEAYTWGSNVNFALGQPHGDSSSVRPQLVVAQLGRSHRKLSFKAVSTAQYHTIFLTASGHVFVCGFGQGGRLGLGDTKPVLKPTYVASLKKHTITVAAAGRDHSVFVTVAGSVFACGSNKFGQLGLPDSEAEHTPIVLKVLKHFQCVGVSASTVATVLFNRTSMYTFGKNNGQLGHSIKEDQPRPRLVSLFETSNLRIVDARTSDFATVCLAQEDGANRLIVFDNHTTRRMSVNSPRRDYFSSVGVSIVKIRAVSHESGWFALAGVTHDGAVYVSNGTGFCLVEFRHGLVARDVALWVGRGQSVGMAVVSKSGAVFTCTLDKRHFHVKQISPVVQVTRVPDVHQIHSIACDGSGKHFAAVRQSSRHVDQNLLEALAEDCSTLPEVMALLLEEIETGLCDDTDITLECDGGSLPAHKFVLWARCKGLRKHLDTDTVSLSDVAGRAVSLEQGHALLAWAYTGQPGLSMALHRALRLEAFSLALPFSLRQEEAGSEMPHADVFVARTDSEQYPAHKFLLARRSPYFEARLMSRWAAASSSFMLANDESESSAAEASISLPIEPSEEAFTAAMTFIYTDSLTWYPMTTATVLDVLALADALLLDGLVAQCERELIGRLDLSNFCNLITAANVFQAPLLASWCGAFACRNFEMLWEARVLESLTEQELAIIEEALSQHIPNSRCIALDDLDTSKSSFPRKEGAGISDGSEELTDEESCDDDDDDEVETEKVTDPDAAPASLPEEPSSPEKRLSDKTAPPLLSPAPAPPPESAPDGMLAWRKPTFDETPTKSKRNNTNAKGRRGRRGAAPEPSTPTSTEQQAPRPAWGGAALSTSPARTGPFGGAWPGPAAAAAATAVAQPHPLKTSPVPAPPDQSPQPQSARKGKKKKKQQQSAEEMAPLPTSVEVAPPVAAGKQRTWRKLALEHEAPRPRASNAPAWGLAPVPAPPPSQPEPEATPAAELGTTVPVGMQAWRKPPAEEAAAPARKNKRKGKGKSSQALPVATAPSPTAQPPAQVAPPRNTQKVSLLDIQREQQQQKQRRPYSLQL